MATVQENYQIILPLSNGREELRKQKTDIASYWEKKNRNIQEKLTFSVTKVFFSPKIEREYETKDQG